MIIEYLKGMSSPKIILLSSLMSIVLTALLVGGVVWKWQGGYYKSLIAGNNYKAEVTLRKLTQEKLETERNNEQLTQKLNKQAAEANEERNKLLADNLGLVTKYNGMRFTNSSCKNATGASNRASSSTVSETQSSECVLPAEATQLIIEATNAADTLTDRMSICEAYAESIQQQRERMIKEQNNGK